MQYIYSAIQIQINILFIISLFVVKGSFRRWILISVVLAIMLSWGKNFMFLTDLFLEHFPGYNKFRAVSTILVIVEFLIPLLAFYGLNKILIKSENLNFDVVKKSFYISIKKLDKKLNYKTQSTKKILEEYLENYINIENNHIMKTNRFIG